MNQIPRKYFLVYLETVFNEPLTYAGIKVFSHTCKGTSSVVRITKAHEVEVGMVKKWQHLVICMMSAF